jgi:serine/threonine protein phosphatase PrpC
VGTIHRSNADLISKDKLKQSSLFWRRNPVVEGQYTVMLPQNPRENAELKIKTQYSRVFAKVRKKWDRERCQDTALVSIDGKNALIGVFDGFGGLGDFFPGLVAHDIGNFWKKTKKRITSAQDLKDMLIQTAIRSLLELYSSNMRGGTTAIVAAILPDRRFLVANIGDSVGYLMDGDGHIRRILEDETMILPDGSRERLSKINLHPDLYSWARNILPGSISEQFGEEQIDICEGVIGPKSRLVLVSDGITKNLFVKTNQEGGVFGVDGCDDLMGITCGRVDVEDIGREIITESAQRASTNIRRSFGKGMNEGMLLIPGDDDMSVVVYGAD